MTFYVDSNTPKDLETLRTEYIEALQSWVRNLDLTDLENLKSVEKKIDQIAFCNRRLSELTQCIKCQSTAAYSYASPSIAHDLKCIYQRFTHCDECGTQVDPIKYLYRGDGHFVTAPEQD